MPISGIIIKYQQDKLGDLLAPLESISGLELRDRIDDSCLIAVLEAETVNQEVDTISSIMNIDGVLDVRLAYHNFEDLVNS